MLGNTQSHKNAELIQLGRELQSLCSCLVFQRQFSQIDPLFTDEKKRVKLKIINRLIKFYEDNPNNTNFQKPESLNHLNITQDKFNISDAVLSEILNGINLALVQGLKRWSIKDSRHLSNTHGLITQLKESDDHRFLEVSENSIRMVSNCLTEINQYFENDESLEQMEQADNAESDDSYQEPGQPTLITEVNNIMPAPDNQNPEHVNDNAAEVAEREEGNLADENAAEDLAEIARRQQEENDRAEEAALAEAEVNPEEGNVVVEPAVEDDDNRSEVSNNSFVTALSGGQRDIANLNDVEEVAEREEGNLADENAAEDLAEIARRQQEENDRAEEAALAEAEVNPEEGNVVVEPAVKNSVALSSQDGFLGALNVARRDGEDGLVDIKSFGSMGDVTVLLQEQCADGNENVLANNTTESKFILAPIRFEDIAAQLNQIASNNSNQEGTIKLSIPVLFGPPSNHWRALDATIFNGQVIALSCWDPLPKTAERAEDIKSKIEQVISEIDEDNKQIITGEEGNDRPSLVYNEDNTKFGGVQQDESDACAAWAVQKILKENAPEDGWPEGSSEKKICDAGDNLLQLMQACVSGLAGTEEAPLPLVEDNGQYYWRVSGEAGEVKDVNEAGIEQRYKNQLKGLQTNDTDNGITEEDKTDDTTSDVSSDSGGEQSRIENSLLENQDIANGGDNKITVEVDFGAGEKRSIEVTLPYPKLTDAPIHKRKNEKVIEETKERLKKEAERIKKAQAEAEEKQKKVQAEKTLAASKIQSLFRGYSARKTLQEKRQQQLKQWAEEKNDVLLDVFNANGIPVSFDLPMKNENESQQIDLSEAALKEKFGKNGTSNLEPKEIKVLGSNGNQELKVDSPNGSTANCEKLTIRRSPNNDQQAAVEVTCLGNAGKCQFIPNEPIRLNPQGEGAERAKNMLVVASAALAGCKKEAKYASLTDMLTGGKKLGYSNDKVLSDMLGLAVGCYVQGEKAGGQKIMPRARVSAAQAKQLGFSGIAKKLEQMNKDCFAKKPNETKDLFDLKLCDLFKTLSQGKGGDAKNLSEKFQQMIQETYGSKINLPSDWQQKTFKEISEGIAKASITPSDQREERFEYGDKNMSSVFPAGNPQVTSPPVADNGSGAPPTPGNH